jgi:hypothetical protein
MNAVCCFLILLGIMARLLKYQSKPLDLAMKAGMLWASFQLVRVTAAALK